LTHGAAQTKPLIVRFSLSFGVESRSVERICAFARVGKEKGKKKKAKHQTRGVKYRADYNNNPPSDVAFIPDIAYMSGRLHSEFIRLLFVQDHRETDPSHQG